MKILVTGGAGFIGSHTVPLLLEQGDNVLVLDNLSTGKLTNLDLSHPNLEFFEGDILEFPLLEELLADCNAVLHLAAISSVPESIENPIYTMQVNTQGYLHVLQAVRNANHTIRLVYASSASVYGDPEQLPCADDQEITHLPLSPYAIQKLHAEQYASLFANLFGIDSLALRYFNVYGPGQDPNSSYSGVISRFCAAYLANAPCIIFGDGKQSRDFIHVRDVAKANLLALKSDYCGKLNIATGEPQNLLQLIKYLEATLDKPAKIEHAPARRGDIRSSYAATQLAAQHINFESSIKLQDGIKELLTLETV